MREYCRSAADQWLAADGASLGPVHVPGDVADGLNDIEACFGSDGDTPTIPDHVVHILRVDKSARLGDHQLPGQAIPGIHVFFDMSNQSSGCDVGK